MGKPVFRCAKCGNNLVLEATAVENQRPGRSNYDSVFKLTPCDQCIDDSYMDGYKDLKSDRES